MGPYIAQARMEEPGARMTNLPDVLNLLGPDGDWALVTSHGLAGQETAEISLLSGQRLTVPFGPLGAVAIPSNLVLDGKNVLAWTNCQPLGMFFGHVLVLHGPAGWQAAFRLNGKTYRETIDADAPTVVETPHLSVVLMTSELAMRSWPLEEEIVCGPDFVGETTDDIEHARGAKQYWRIKPGGKVTTTQVKSPGASSKSAKRAHPRLGKFQPLGPCPEPTAEDVSWQKLPGPQGVDKLGQYYGYVWYRVAWEAARARKPKIYLPHCEDRARLYLNGRFVGVWGQGPDATREPLSVSMRRGQNVLVALVDNMGRYNYPHWRLGELKGLTDHVWEAKPLRTRKFKLRQAEGFARRIVPRHMTHLIGRLEEQQVWQASLEIPLTTVTPLHMRFEGLPCTMAAFCNDRPIGFWEATGTAWGDVRLGPELTKGNNKITLTCWGELDAKDLERIKFYQLTENLTEEGQWAWRPWHVPGGEASPDGEARVLADVPAGFVTRFKYTEDDRPMFVRLEGEGKGQLYLNGKDVGRYWSIGPQQRYYLPACWLDEENELVLFEETGVAPTGGKLEFCPAGPYED
jgi:hypothetical protein